MWNGCVGMTRPFLFFATDGPHNEQCRLHDGENDGRQTNAHHSTPMVLYRHVGGKDDKNHFKNGEEEKLKFHVSCLSLSWLRKIYVSYPKNNVESVIDHMTYQYRRTSDMYSSPVCIFRYIFRISEFCFFSGGGKDWYRANFLPSNCFCNGE